MLRSDCQSAARALWAVAHLPGAPLDVIAHVIAAHCGADGLVPAQALEEAARQGLVEQWPVARTGDAGWAVTASGLARVAAICGVSPATAAQRLDYPQRLWAARSDVGLVIETHRLCARSFNAAEQALWEVMVLRSHLKHPLRIHARIGARRAGPGGEQGARAWLLINDRGEGSVLRWAAHLRYIVLWSRRMAGRVFPPLLVLTTRPFREWAVLALARVLGARAQDGAETDDSDMPDLAHWRAAPLAGLSIFASSGRGVALARGLQNAEWKALGVDFSLARVNPFAAPEWPAREIQKGGEAWAHWPRWLAMTDPAGARRARAQNTPSDAAPGTELPNIWIRPPQLDGIERADALDADARAAWLALARQPLCPLSYLAAFAGSEPWKPERVAAALESLRAAGLADRVERLSPDFAARAQKRAEQRKKTKRGTLKMPELWRLTDDGLRLRAVQEGLPALELRYRFFLRDQMRRPEHTVVVCRFFERLKADLDQRARASRPLEISLSNQAGRDNGDAARIPHYALGACESEMVSSQYYKLGEERRFFRPDGYGSVRAGTVWTRFFLEIDGWLDEQGGIGSPSVVSPEVWRGKMERLLDYFTSGRWALRYPEFPRVLIVTTDLRNTPIIMDSAIMAARGRGVTAPRVAVARAADVAQSGPCGKIWRRVDGSVPVGNLSFAFDDFEQPGVTRSDTRMERVDIIAEVARLDALRQIGAQVGRKIRRRR